jgi:hypothetical protein
VRRNHFQGCDCSNFPEKFHIVSAIVEHRQKKVMVPLVGSYVTCSGPEGHCRYHGVWVPLSTSLSQAPRPSQLSQEFPLHQGQAKSRHMPHHAQTCPPTGARSGATMYPIVSGSRALAGAGSKADTCTTTPGPVSLPGQGSEATCGQGKSGRSVARWMPHVNTRVPHATSQLSHA